jgi:sterol desaturase/sphingolipid hydroxylase (fatty acid hydroxylase superfamily)
MKIVRGPTSSVIEYALQPLLLLTAFSFWYFNQQSLIAYPLIVLGVQLVLGFIEYQLPARPDWLLPAKQKIGLILLVIAIFIYSGSIAAPFYAITLDPMLSDIRSLLGIDVWPHHWPMIGQVILAFFLSELIWYWFHRAEHRWSLVWRLSGHGAHHSFKNLGAINFGANHPLEYFVLLVPSAIVELLFGAGAAIGGAAILLVTQASIVHSNIPTNSKGIGWLLTTNHYHIHHHSLVIEESNTNYGCAVILWDRLFGTFSDNNTIETGIGPSEPSMWNKLLIPLKEPSDSQISP